MRIFNRNTIAAFLLGGALAAGAGALAVERHMGGSHAAVDASAHAERMLKHLYVEVDATDAQKAKIEPLVRQAMQDLQPIHSQLRGAHAELLTWLGQPTLDAGALEAMRVQKLQLADQASKRLVQLIADVGEVLTPEQRNKLAAHLGKLHERRHG